MIRTKTFNATGIATAGRLYAGDLNAIQDAAAGLTDYTQNIATATVSFGSSDLQVLKYGAGEFRMTGAMRADGILRGLSGLVGGTYTSTARDAIVAPPYGLMVLNTTTNRYEYNSGSSGSPSWQPMHSPAGLGTADFVDGSVTSAKIADGTIVNADVNAGAAIVYSKLNLAGSLVNADVTNGTLTTAKFASVTGTGAVVLAASPTLSGTITAAAITASGTVAANALTTTLAVTASGNVVANSGAAGQVSLQSASGQATVYFNASGVDYITRSGSGILSTNSKFGIQSAGPNNQLDVVGNGIGAYIAGTANGGSPVAASIYLGDSNFNTSGFYDSAPGMSAIWNTAASVPSDLAFYVYTGGSHARTEVMRLIRGGKVGIMQTAPAYPLDVTGSINSTGQVLASNQVVSGSEVIARNTVGTMMTMGSISGSAGLLFGNSTGPNLYKTASDAIQTDTKLAALGHIYGAWNGSHWGVEIGAVANGIVFNGDANVNLYWSTTSVLKSDAVYFQLQDTTFACGTNGGMFVGVSPASFYRSAANQFDCYAGGFGTIRAATFAVSSDRQMKNDIKPFEDVERVAHQILSVQPYTFKRKGSNDTHFGMMADEMPLEVLHTSVHPDNNAKMTLSIDTYKLLTASIVTMQSMNRRIVAIEHQLSIR